MKMAKEKNNSKSQSTQLLREQDISSVAPVFDSSDSESLSGDEMEKPVSELKEELKNLVFDTVNGNSDGDIPIKSDEVLDFKSTQNKTVNKSINSKEVNKVCHRRGDVGNKSDTVKNKSGDSIKSTTSSKTMLPSNKRNHNVKSSKSLQLTSKVTVSDNRSSTGAESVELDTAVEIGNKPTDNSSMSHVNETTVTIGKEKENADSTMSIADQSSHTLSIESETVQQKNMSALHMLRKMKADKAVIFVNKLYIHC